MQESLTKNESDLHVNFNQNNVSNAETKYFFMAEVRSSLLAGYDLNSFSVLYSNIRSIKKNLNVNFNAICLVETWCKSQEESGSSNYILSGYSCFHQYREYCRGEGVYLLVAKPDKMS